MSLLVLPGLVLANCEPWCTEPCKNLNGNVRLECGGCLGEGESSCQPGAPGFPTGVPPPAMASKSLQPRCGRLIPSHVADMAPLCVHLLPHAPALLGELKLLNSSASSGTRTTRLRAPVLWLSTSRPSTHRRVDSLVDSPALPFDASASRRRVIRSDTRTRARSREAVVVRVVGA